MYKIITTIKSTETAIYDDDGSLLDEWPNHDGVVYEDTRYELTPDEIEEYK